MLAKKLEQVSGDSRDDRQRLRYPRLKRIEEMKANAIEATPVIDGEKVDADRRFRRI